MVNACPSCGRLREDGQKQCPCGWRPEGTPSGGSILGVLAIGGVIVLLLVAIIAGAGMILWHNFSRPAVSARPTPVVVSAPAPPTFSPTTAPAQPVIAPRPPTLTPAIAAPTPQPITTPAPATPMSETDRLVAQLRSPSYSKRQEAVEALQARNWQPANDEQAALAYVATQNPLLAEKYGDAAVEALCAPLADLQDDDAGAVSASCLGHLLDTRATPPLTRALLQSTSPRLRRAAATALGQIRDPQSLPSLKQALDAEKDDTVKERLTAAIAKLTASDGADRLVAALSDDEPKVQLRAATLLLRKSDPRAMTWMAEAVNRDDTDMRQSIIALLRQAGSPEAINILVARVGGAGYDGPIEAADALVQLGQPAITPMVASLPKMKHNGRWIMLMALARLGQPAMQPLVELLPTAAPDLKKTACQALAGAASRDDVKHKPVEPLVALLNDPDPKIRGYAADSLEQLQWEPNDSAEKELWARARGK